MIKRAYWVDSYLDTYDGKFLPGSAVGGKSLLGRRTILAHCRALPGCRAGADGGDGDVGRALSGLRAVLGLGHHAVETHGGVGRQHRRGNAISAVGDEWFDRPGAGRAFKVHISEPGKGRRVVCTRPRCCSPEPWPALGRWTWSDRFGNFDVGKEADFVVVDPSGTSGIAGRDERTGCDLETRTLAREQTLFALLMDLRESSIVEVYVRGSRVTAELDRQTPDDKPPGNYGHFVRRRTVLKLPLLLAAGPTLTQVPRGAAEQSRWSPDRANRWYQAQGWLVGANYITSNAINQLEMFQADTFDPRRIDTELGWARLHGLNTVRVFLHDQLWAQDNRGFQRRLAQFVTLRRATASNHSSSCSTHVGIHSPSRDGNAHRSLGSTTPVGCKAQALNTSMTSTTAALCSTM